MTYKDAGKIAMLLKDIADLADCGYGAEGETVTAGLKAVAVLRSEFPKIGEMYKILEEELLE